MRRASARIREHRLGEVDADNVRASIVAPGNDVARPGGDVEQALPWPGAHRIEERIGQARCHAAGQRVVTIRLFRSPAGLLERIEGDGVVFADAREYAVSTQPLKKTRILCVREV